MKVVSVGVVLLGESFRWCMYLDPGLLEPVLLSEEQAKLVAEVDLGDEILIVGVG